MERKLQNLELLYRDMAQKKETRAVFGVSFRERRFSCFFLTDIVPFKLYVAALGDQRFAISFSIKKDFSFSAFLNKSDYERLVHYLGLVFDPVNHFSPADFLMELDSRFPTRFTHRPRYSDCLLTAASDIEEPNKIYFVGWRTSPTGRVSSLNEEKTRRAFGDEMAKASKTHGISSCWTTEKSLEELNRLNDLINRKI